MTPPVEPEPGAGYSAGRLGRLRRLVGLRGLGRLVLLPGRGLWLRVRRLLHDRVRRRGGCGRWWRRCRAGRWLRLGLRVLGRRRRGSGRLRLGRCGLGRLRLRRGSRRSGLLGCRRQREERIVARRPSRGGARRDRQRELTGTAGTRSTAMTRPSSPTDGAGAGGVASRPRTPPIAKPTKMPTIDWMDFESIKWASRWTLGVAQD